MNPLAQALQRATDHPESAQRKPTYRIGGFRLSLAKDTSANPGYIYIKNSDYQYLGKIAPDGRIASKGLDTAEKNFLQEVIAAPETAAMKEGRVTGICCCCGRTLTNPVSVKLGIGPVCRGYYFPAAEEVAPPSILDLGLEELPETAQQELDISIASLASLHKIVDEGAIPTYRDPLEEALEETKLEVNDLVDAFKHMSTDQQIIFFAKIGAYLAATKSINEAIRSIS